MNGLSIPLRIEDSPRSQNGRRCNSVCSNLRHSWRGVIAGILLLGLFAWGALAGEEVPSPVRAGSELDYPPFCVVNQRGEADGFAVELMRAALHAMGRDVTFQVGQWSELKEMLRRGELDALPLVGRTPERESIFDFTFPYLSMHGAIVVREGNSSVQTLSDLEGREVAVMRGDNAEEFLRREERDFTIRTAKTYGEALAGLAEGKYDAVIVQRLVALRLIQEEGLSNLLVLRAPLEGFRQDWAFAVTEGDRETLALLNEGLALVIADGTYRRLHAKWFASFELPSNRPIIVGGDHNFPPFEFLDEGGRPAGFNVDITKAIARATGLDVEIRLGPWNEVRQALASSEIDALQGMFYSVERDREFDFTQPYTVVQYVSVVREGGAPPPTTLAQLKGKRIVVQRGDIMHDYAIENDLEGQLTVVDAQEDALRELAEGKHDCALLSRLTALYWIDRQGWDNLVAAKTPLLAPGYCFAAPENDKALIAQLGEGLKVLEESGEFRRIHEKWMGVYEPDRPGFLDILTYSGIVIVPLVLVLLGSILWSRSLRKQVALRTAELHRSQAILQAAMDHSPAGIAIARAPDGELEYVNAAGLAVRGLSHEEIVNGVASGDYTSEWNIRDLNGEPLPTDDIPLAHAVKFGEETSREFIVRRPDGEDRHVYAEAAPIRDEKGRVVSGVVVFLDVTERKLAEEELRAREEQYRLLADHTLDVIWTMNMALEFTYVNPAVERVTGHTREEWIGTQLQEHCDEASFRKMAEVIQTELAKGAEHAGVIFEAEMLHKDGSTFPVEIHGQVVFDATDTPICLQGTTRDITERKQAEEALREASMRLEAAVKAGNVGLWDWDLRTNSVFFSDEWKRQIGYERHEIGNDFHEWRERVHPDDLASALQRIEAALNSRQDSYQNEFRFRHRDGSYRWILVQASIMRDDEGQPVRALGSHLDITERKNAEMKLRESEARLQRIFDILPVGLWFADSEGNLLRGNRAGIGIWGAEPHVSPPEYGVFKARRLPSGEEIRAEDWALARTIRERVTIADEILEIQAFDGKKKIILNSTAPVFDEDGALLGAIVLNQDITERKRAEKALEESETRYRLLAETARDIIILHDLDGKILYANKAGVEFSGYSEEAFLEHNILEFIPEEYLPDLLERKQRRLAGHKGNLLFELEFVNEQGTRFPVEVSSALVEQDGKPTSVLVVARDISERRHADAERLRLEEQYRQAQKMEAIGQLTGGVAHDFNNLLQVINGATDMAIDDVGRDHPAHDFLLEVAKAGERAANLVQQLLLFSRRQIMRPHNLDLNSLVGDLLKMLGRVIGEHVRVEWLPARQLGMIYADRSMIEQAVMNLCVNARDAMPEGGVLTLESENVRFDSSYCNSHTWATPGRYVMLSVTDTGHGMDKKTLEQIFEPFFTTKETGKGTGLGLATVYGIVRQHDGMITAYSEPQKGTTFKLYFPVSERSAEEVGSKIQSRPTGGTETILLAEDDSMVRNLARTFLERAGYTVITADDGAEAVVAFKERPDDIDIAVLDVVMPEMGGREAYEQMRRIRPDLKVLFSSGYSENAVHTNFVLHEGLRLIQKPYDRDDFLREVRRALDDLPPQDG